MFVLNPEKFSDFNLNNIKEFIDFWDKIYEQKTHPKDEEDNPINYMEELNIGKELTQNNIKRLLMWKDPRNPREVENITLFNNFRFNKIKEVEFMTTQNFYETGTVMKTFLFHICKPFQYPIIDQHVVRAFKCHTGKEFNTEKDLEENWNFYINDYCPYFWDVAKEYGLEKRDHSWDPAYIQDLKKIDNALMAFGQFLSKYQIK